MKKNIAKAWEERGRVFRDTKKAVMDQSFPLVINEYIESIHLGEIEKVIDRKIESCLDVGCGYGRIAKLIAKQHSNIFVHGVDISETFVKLFNKKLKGRGKAVVGDIRKLPFKDNMFDLVWVIVSFMYLENKKDQQNGMQELFRVLKPGGKLILIEPNALGVNIVRLWGFIPFVFRILLGKKKVETFGIAFPDNAIDKLISYAQGDRIYKRGYPMFTLFLLPNVFLGRFVPNITRIMLKTANLVDKIFFFSSLSYFITYVAIKRS